ncbi:MAG: ROK family protein [Microbacterium sp.]|uniref:ROK family protein n=1 Tax=Microbacterium sp. TaxID=51671 RepID=UPI0039E3220A
MSSEQPSWPPLHLATGPLGHVNSTPQLLSALCRLIASRQAVSKADLVSVTGVPRTTVSTAVDRLLRDGTLVYDGLRHAPGRGRPAERLVLSPQRALVLGIELDAYAVTLGVFDLNQTLRATAAHAVSLFDGPRETLDTVADAANALLDELGTPRASVHLGIIGVPGPVDVREGIPIRPWRMPGWHAYRVVDELEERIGVPMSLENVVNLRALGEARALGPSSWPLIYIDADARLDGGIILGDGTLHRGMAGGAADFGHLRPRDAPAVRCPCGNVGCLEATSSAVSLVASLLDRAPESLSAADLDLLRVRIEHEDTAAMALVEAAAAHVGEAVALLLHVLNPARVSLRGVLTSSSDAFLSGIRSIVYGRAQPLATRNLQIVNSVLDTRAALAGAAVMGIESALAPSAFESAGT